MKALKSSLTVFFEEPFWVGVFERIIDEKLSVCKITFGAEPKDYEVLDFVLKNYYTLEFSLGIDTEIRRIADNPKRRQKNVRKQMGMLGIGTKSQQAIKKQYELSKSTRKDEMRKQREADKKWQFELKQQKRKAKRRGK